jgi:4-hydroxy-tetrahydrodipicolinate reductase
MAETISVVGTGRMGSLAIEIIEQTEGLELHSRLDSKSSLDEINGADTVIDFTKFEVSKQVVEKALANGQHVIIGTSGWDEGAVESIRHLIGDSSVLLVPNFSVGSMLLQMFSASAAKFFDSVEIIEGHHPHKIDSPSGTAVRTAELMAEARGSEFVSPNTDQKARGESVKGIPIHSMRMQGVSAMQEVHLGNEFESIKLSHNTNSHQAYAKGMQLAMLSVSRMRGLNIGLSSLIEQ